MAGSSKKRRPPKITLPRSEIIARQVRMARAALGLTLAEFGELVGLSANTISHIEHAHVTLSRTTDGLEEALRGVAAIELLPDTGESIGIRLHYSRLSEPLERAPRRYAFKQGRGIRRHDPDEVNRGMIGSDYPMDKYLEELSDHEKRYGRDRRLGKRSDTDVDGRMPNASSGASPAPEKGVVGSEALAELRIADGQNPIRVWREYRNMPLTTLAKKLRIAKGFLSQIETGKRTAAPKLRDKIARVLGIKPEVLVAITLTPKKSVSAAAPAPANPVKGGSAATASTNEPGIAAPAPDVEIITNPSAGRSRMSPQPMSANMQRLEYLARQEGVPLEKFLDGLGKYHEERKLAEMRERRPRRRST